MAKPLSDPMAFLTLSMNHFQFSFLSKSKTPKQIGDNQLCPLIIEALANCPLSLLVKKMLSMAKYGLQPLMNSSMHGFEAKKKLLNLIFPFKSEIIKVEELPL
jgi:hypothetical protein